MPWSLLWIACRLHFGYLFSCSPHRVNLHNFDNDSSRPDPMNSPPSSFEFPDSATKRKKGYPSKRAPKKKALLIGVCGQGSERLKGPHKDVGDMYDLLVSEPFGYNSSNITTLIDDEDPNNKQPTGQNIVRMLVALKELVHDARAGDRLFFYFAGHSGQVDLDVNFNPEEEDGMDEHIVASDGVWILDDELNELLVKPLPVGCSLRAVIDSCHSGSLLDLEHSKCNRVYVPWVSKGGKRKAKTCWYGTAKQNAILPRFQSVGSLLGRFSGNRISSSISSILDIALRSTRDILPVTLFEEPLCQSPEPRFCDGIRCFNDLEIQQDYPLADVLCLSSSRDDQKSWEDATGRSMTQILIELLRKDPEPTLYDMMKHVSHGIHDIYVNLHPKVRDYQKKRDKFKTTKAKRNGPTPQKTLSLEMANFQDPELSSHIPIPPEDMKTRRWVS